MPNYRAIVYSIRLFDGVVDVSEVLCTINFSAPDNTVAHQIAGRYSNGLDYDLWSEVPLRPVNRDRPSIGSDVPGGGAI